MQLTSIEYNAIMMAIQLGYNAIEENCFLDPFDDNPDGYTNESLAQALSSVESKIINANITD